MREGEGESPLPATGVNLPAARHAAKGTLSSRPRLCLPPSFLPALWRGGRRRQRSTMLRLQALASHQLPHCAPQQPSSRATGDGELVSDASDPGLIPSMV